MQIRPAETNDIEAIARLHALSWQQNYSGVLSVDYLSNKVGEERLKVWNERLTTPASNQCVLLIESDGVIIGFVCVFGGHHEKHGTIIDNLHVAHDYKGQGIGKALLRAAAHWANSYFMDLPIYLEVLAANRLAIGFYEALGAIKGPKAYWQTPCGNKVAEYIYSWDVPSDLLTD